MMPIKPGRIDHALLYLRSTRTDTAHQWRPNPEEAMPPEKGFQFDAAPAWTNVWCERLLGLARKVG